jgi:outer membrane protein TolC
LQHRLRKYLIILFLPVLFFPVTLLSQDTLSYRQILDEMLRRNQSLLISNLNLSLAGAEYDALSGFFPSFPELEIEAETDRKVLRKIEYTLTQKIDISGRRSLARDAADLNFKRTQAMINRSRYELITVTRKLLNNIIIQQSKLQIAEQIKALNDELVISSERRLLAGDIPELEMNLIEIESNRILAELQDINQQLRSQYTELNLLLNRPPDRRIYIRTDSLIFTRELNIEDIRLRALRSRSDLRAIEYEILAAETEIRISRRLIVPDFKLIFGIVQERHVSGDRENLLKFGIGFPVPLPIPGLYNTFSGNIRASEIRRDILEARKKLLEAEILAEVTIAYDNYINSLNRYELLRRNSELIDRTLELLHRGYTRGELSLIEYLNQRRNLLEEQLNFYNAFQELNDYLLELEKAVQINLL